MKKVVLKLELTDDKSKKKAMKIVSGLSGVESIAMDMKEKKLTVIGEIDAVDIVGKLRKLCHTDIVSVGPAKEPEKKKEEPKKEAAAADKKKEEPKKDNNQQLLLNAQLMKQYYMQQQQYHQQQQQYYQQHQTPSTPMPTHYYARSVEEDPNACVIC